MTPDLDEYGWAYQEFHRAFLGDQRLTQRLVQIAAQAARTPGGAITAVFCTAAEREGAFRFVENDRFCAADVAASAHAVCALRASAFPFVFVPLDGSSLLLCDEQGKKGLGGVGCWNKGGKGLQTMTAIALSSDGIRWACWAKRCGRENSARSKPARTSGRRISASPRSGWT